MTNVTVQVLHYDSFTRQPNMGNPAGVIVDEAGLSDTEMQAIATKVGFNECAFVLPSDTADLRLRYFTPGHEIDLCGHGTVAALTALAEGGTWEGKPRRIAVETNAGTLPMDIDYLDGELYITMHQASPEFVKFEGDVAAIAGAVGLTASDIDNRYPLVYGSTGNWTLLVPIRSVEAFSKMVPQNELFPSLLGQKPEASVHLWTRKTIHENSDMHGRHFSSPRSGTVEDPVTGTASGVMGAFYATYVRRLGPGSELRLVVEQGQEIGRDGKVDVSIAHMNGNLDVAIRGTAVLVDCFSVEI